MVKSITGEIHQDSHTLKTLKVSKPTTQDSLISSIAKTIFRQISTLFDFIRAVILSPVLLISRPTYSQWTGGYLKPQAELPKGQPGLPVEPPKTTPPQSASNEAPQQTEPQEIHSFWENTCKPQVKYVTWLSLPILIPMALVYFWPSTPQPVEPSNYNPVEASAKSSFEETSNPVNSLPNTGITSTLTRYYPAVPMYDPPSSAPASEAFPWLTVGASCLALVACALGIKHLYQRICGEKETTFVPQPRRDTTTPASQNRQNQTPTSDNPRVKNEGQKFLTPSRSARPSVIGIFDPPPVAQTTSSDTIQENPHSSSVETNTVQQKKKKRPLLRKLATDSNSPSSNKKNEEPIDDNAPFGVATHNPFSALSSIPEDSPYSVTPTKSSKPPQKNIHQKQQQDLNAPQPRKGFKPVTSRVGVSPQRKPTANPPPPLPPSNAPTNSSQNSNATHSQEPKSVEESTPINNNPSNQPAQPLSWSQKLSLVTKSSKPSDTVKRGVGKIRKSVANTPTKDNPDTTSTTHTPAPPPPPPEQSIFKPLLPFGDSDLKTQKYKLKPQSTTSENSALDTPIKNNTKQSKPETPMTLMFKKVKGQESVLERLRSHPANTDDSSRSSAEWD